MGPAEILNTTTHL